MSPADIISLNKNFTSANHCLLACKELSVKLKAPAVYSRFKSTLKCQCTGEDGKCTFSVHARRKYPRMRSKGDGDDSWVVSEYTAHSCVWVDHAAPENDAREKHVRGALTHARSRRCSQTAHSLAVRACAHDRTAPIARPHCAARERQARILGQRPPAARCETFEAQSRCVRTLLRLSMPCSSFDIRPALPHLNGIGQHTFPCARAYLQATPQSCSGRRSSSTCMAGTTPNRACRTLPCVQQTLSSVATRRS